MALEGKSSSRTFQDREKPTQVRASNITAAKGNFVCSSIFEAASYGCTVRDIL